MTFEEYCTSKNIDAEKFKTADEAYFLRLKNLFDQMHPNSFTQQKLFLINKIRRQYQLS